MIGMPLALMAILAGVYLPIRRRRFGASIFALWFFALLVAVCQKILVTSAVGMQGILIDQMQDAVERGYVLDRPEGVNALPKSRPLVYRVNHGVRWPIFYQKMSERQARIYHPWVWGQKVGGVIDVERGLLSLE